MLISKFNRLIRNRLLWGIFGTIVCVSFVGLFTQGGGCVGASQGPSVGTIAGKTIAPGVLQRQKFHVFLWLRMMSGREFQVTPEMDARMTEQAWKRIVELDMAAKLGLTANDDEVRSAIQQDPTFAAGGQYNPQYYAAFVNNFLAGMGVSAQQFEAYMREEIVLEKLRRMVASGAWVTPTEIEARVRDLTDSFTVSLAEMPLADLTRDVAVSDEDVRGFFEKNRKAFTIPEKVQVAYSAFPIDAFKTGIEVSGDDVTNYYNAHMDAFMSTDTNGEPVMLKLDDVVEQIRDGVTRDAAAEKAREAAYAFIEKLFTDKQGKAVPFEQAAAEAGHTVATSEFFSAGETPKDLLVGPEFSSVAFGLSLEPDEYFSEPVMGTNALYVLALKARTEPRVPELEEVAETARQAALRHAQAQAMSGKETALLTAVREAMAGGKSFAEAVAPWGMAATNAGPFTAYTAPEILDSARLITAVVSKQQGELTDLVPTERQTLLLGHIITRAAGEAAAEDPVRNQVRAGMARRQAQLVLSDWERGLLSMAEIKAAADIEDEAEAETNEDDALPPIVD